jgi:hypothetical protein
MFHVEVDFMWVVMAGCVAAIFAVISYVLRLAVQQWREAHSVRHGSRVAMGRMRQAQRF